MILSDLEKKIIKILQEDFPLTPNPFRDIAHKLGIEEEFLISKIQTFIDQGIIRRFGAALMHRNLGFKANAMVVCQVPPQLVKKAGENFAKLTVVSHCYERPTFPHWPYNLFTMIHGESVEECEQIAKEMAKSEDIKNYKLLFSSREFKKTSMKYFC